MANGYNVDSAMINQSLASLASSRNMIDESWSGAAKESMVTELNGLYDELSKNLDDIEKFSANVQKQQNYEYAIEQYKIYSMELYGTGLAHSTLPEDQPRIAELERKVNYWKQEYERLRTELVAFISSIEPVTSRSFSISSSGNLVSTYSYEMLSDRFGPDFAAQFQEYMDDPIKLQQLLYRNDSLNIYSGSSTGGELSAEDFQYIYDFIYNNSGDSEDRGVKSAMALVVAAAITGSKLPYTFGGGHNGESDVQDILNGVDCSGFASWVVNQSVGGGLNPIGANAFQDYCDEISFEQAEPGDVMIYHEGQSDVHAVVYLGTYQNEAGEDIPLIIAADNPTSGVQVRRIWNYSDIYDYTIYDSSSIQDV